MYANIDYKTKKQLKEAIAAGKQIGVFNPSGFFPAPSDGRVTLEGPHYPQPHKWYATAVIKNGMIVKVS